MLKTIEQRVLKLIDENHLIEKNEKLLVALSGGADSVFLFHFMLKYQRRLGISFSAFHLNHKIRDKDAKKDELFCKNLCDRNNVKLFLVEKDVKNYAKKRKLSVEEAGRIIRYEEMNKIADKNSFNKIATAHNASDNVETVLLNLTKGAGSKGLSGIPVRREKIIRPVLSLTSAEIRNYLKQKKIDSRVDKSNLEIDYERNFIRKKILPELKKLNPKVEQKILNSAGTIKEMRSYIDAQFLNMEQNSVTILKDEKRINLKKLAEFDKRIWGDFLKYLISKYYNIDLSNNNLKSLLELSSNQSGKKLSLANKVIAVKERTYISFRKEVAAKQKIYEKTVPVNRKIKVYGHYLQIEKVKIDEVKPSRKKNIEYISADKLLGEFKVRKWKAGDRFFPFGMTGSKKISDFLADEKIPSSKKSEQLLLTNSNKIIWVIGLRLDDRFKITQQTKKAIKLVYL